MHKNTQYLSQQSLFPLDNRKRGLKSWWWWCLRGGGVGREMEHGREYRDIRQRCSRKHGVISTKQRWRKKWSQGDGQKRIYYDYEKWHIRHSVCKTSFWLFLTLCIATLIKKWNKQVQSYAVYNKEWKKLIKTKKVCTKHEFWLHVTIVCVYISLITGRVNLWVNFQNQCSLADQS